MKNRFLLFALCVQVFSSTNMNGQSWEVFFEDPSLPDAYPYFVLPGPNGSSRLTCTSINLPTPLPIYSFDPDGNYIGETTIPNLSDWYLYNTDNEGATYWINPYTIRKYTADNQLAWSYTPPVISGVLWEKAAPNGGTCLQYFDGVPQVQVVDWVNADGQLTNRFEFPSSSAIHPLPGYDNSLIYTEDSDHWIKLDQNKQVMWELDLSSTGFPSMGGSLPDGSTLCLGGDILTKIDATGNTAWARNITDFLPADISPWDYRLLVRRDGSVILGIGASDFAAGQYVPYFINLDLADGDPIWVKRTANTLVDFVTTATEMAEMPDGGILIGIVGHDTFSFEPRALLVRTDPNGNTLTSQIAGKIFWDENNDCAFQPSEKPRKQVSVIAQSGTKKYSATTDADGKFSMPASSGDYALSIAQPGAYWDFCGLPATLNLDASNDTAQVEIGAKATVICPEMQVSIGSNVFRRCFDNNSLSVHFQNFGTAPAEDAFVTVTLDPKLFYLSATAPLAGQNGLTYRFDLGTVGVGESGSFNIRVKVDCDAALGEILCVDGHVYPDTLCGTTIKSMATNRFCLPVVASYDPNDKTAFVDGKPETAKILPDLGLEYLIRFQNTGTDTAFNIVVADTLSAQFDAASVVPGAASHPCFFEMRDGRVLRFTFPNILLPDSTTNEPASHGFVKFSVRQKTGNPIGSTLSNKAAIYFDFNAPVITNESRLLVSPAVHTEEERPVVQPKIWPVPARDWAQILLPTAVVSWQLTDMAGRILRVGGPELSRFVVLRNGLPAGMYLCQFKLANGAAAVGRVVFD